jgi:hypothetical protein
MTRLIVAGFIAFFACLGLLGIKVAKAHDRYEISCCSKQDCAPVADAIVTESAAGFLLNDTGEFIERTSTKVRRPLDERYHLCRNPAGALLCIYPKFSGS